MMINSVFDEFWKITHLSFKVMTKSNRDFF